MDNIWWVIPVVVFAGVVRGYSGFGFAVISVIGLNFFLEPKQSVAVVLSLDLICSINLRKKAINQANFETLKKLTFGSLLGIPIGYTCLLLIPSEILKILICLVIVVLSLFLFSSYRPFDTEKTSTKLAFGLASGAGTASASIGGPMIVYYMLSSNLSTSTQRATMILFFIIIELLSITTIMLGGMVDATLPKALLILLVPTLISVHVGQYLFTRKPPVTLKSFALPVMITVAVLGLVNSTVLILS